MILVVYLSHGVFIRQMLLVFSKSVFGREVLSSQIEEHLRKNVVHFYRSTRLCFNAFTTGNPFVGNNSLELV